MEDMRELWKKFCHRNGVKFQEKEKPKIKTKKVSIGTLWASDLTGLDEDDIDTLVKLIRLWNEGEEIFSEITYKGSDIEFYYYVELSDEG